MEGNLATFMRYFDNVKVARIDSMFKFFKSPLEFYFQFHRDCIMWRNLVSNTFRIIYLSNSFYDGFGERKFGEN